MPKCDMVLSRKVPSNNEIVGAVGEIREFRKKVGDSTDAATTHLRNIALSVGQTVAESNATILKSAQDTAGELRTCATNSSAALLKTIEHVTGALGACVSDAGAAISSAVRQVTNSLGACVVTSNSAIVGSVTEALGCLDTAMAELVKRLNAVEVPNNIFADRFAALADSISSDFEKLRSAILENAAAFTQSLSASVTSMGRVSNEITAIHQAITSARQELARVVTVATETANGTQQFTQSATAAVEAMDRFQKVTSQLATSLEPDFIVSNRFGIPDSKAFLIQDAGWRRRPAVDAESLFARSSGTRRCGGGGWGELPRSRQDLQGQRRERGEVVATVSRHRQRGGEAGGRRAAQLLGRPARLAPGADRGLA